MRETRAPDAALREGPELLRALSDVRRAHADRTFRTDLAAVHHRLKNELQLLAHLVDQQTAGARFGGHVRAIASAHAILTEAPHAPDAGTILERLANECWPALLGDCSLLLDVTREPIRLSPAAASALAVMAHEFVLNALIHAAPQEIVVRLRRAGGGCTLTVRDDGWGFRPGPAAATRGGFGLRMCERLSLQHFGARVECYSVPGQGTTMVAHFPCA